MEKISIGYVVLADFHFHGRHYQIWNKEERLWFVCKREDQDAWELLKYLD